MSARPPARRWNSRGLAAAPSSVTSKPSAAGRPNDPEAELADELVARAGLCGMDPAQTRVTQQALDACTEGQEVTGGGGKNCRSVNWARLCSKSRSSPFQAAASAGATP